MAQPLISIVMPARNAARWLPLSLSSVWTQTCQDWELLIADDGSSDETTAMVQRPGDARIRLLGDARHLGVAARLNQLLGEAKGKFIARFDADDMMHATRLQKQVEFLEANRDVDGLGTALVLLNEKFEPTRVLTHPAEHREICEDPRRRIRLHHPAFMARREWYERWRYNPDNRCCEDWELFYQAHATSRFANLTEPLYFYKTSHLISARWYVRTRAGLAKAIWTNRKTFGTAAATVSTARLYASLIKAPLVPITGAHNFFRGSGWTDVGANVEVIYTQSWNQIVRNATEVFGTDALAAVRNAVSPDSRLHRALETSNAS